MPELMLEVGGRSYSVACEPGEETSLREAAGLFDAEASVIREALGGRAPDTRVLLLAGLMLADKLRETRRTEADNLRDQSDLQAEVKSLKGKVRELEDRPAPEQSSMLPDRELEAAKKVISELVAKVERLAEEIDSQQA